MDHGVSIIPRILEILEIEVSNILYNPGNIGNWIFSIFSYPGNTGNRILLFSHILEIRAAGGRLQGLGSGGLGLFLEYVRGISGYPGNIGSMIGMYFLLVFFFKMASQAKPLCS